MTRFALVLALLTPSIALADDAPAAPPPAPAEIQIDVTDNAATSPSFSGSLALAFGDCGSVEAGNATAHYDLRVCFDNRNGSPDTLSVEVDRTVHGHSELHQKLKTTTRVALGKRVVLGRFGAGADTTEIAATVK